MNTRPYIKKFDEISINDVAVVGGNGPGFFACSNRVLAFPPMVARFENVFLSNSAINARSGDALHRRPNIC